MICIYQLNFTEGSYIGKTTNLASRINHHLRQDSCGTKLKEAWKSQGYLGYTILEECSIEDLNAREVYWISTRRPTLNTLPGGETMAGINHPRNKTSKEDIEEVVRLLETTILTYADIATTVGLPYNRTYDICKGHSHTWATEHLDLSMFDARNCKDLVVYDEYNNEFIVKYGERREFCLSRGIAEGALYRLTDTANKKYGLSSKRHDEYLVTSPHGTELLTYPQLRAAVKQEKSSAYLLERLLKGKTCKGWKVELLKDE